MCWNYFTSNLNEIILRWRMYENMRGFPCEVMKNGAKKGTS